MWEKRKFVRDLVNGETVDEIFSVKFKKPLRPYARGMMFEARVTDRTGDITVKYWGSPDEAIVDQVYSSFKAGDVIHVRGSASLYNDVLEIGVSPEKGGAVEPLPFGEYNVTDFLPQSAEDLDHLMSRLNSYIRKVRDPHLRSLLANFFSDEAFVYRFRASPASIQLHSNWMGGLLEHTLAVVETCDCYARIHPELDWDLTITGAILHDIGKVEEYEITSNINISAEGLLRGHIVIGEQMVNAMIEEMEDFPTNLRLKVLHIILGSHGRREHGSPTEPQFPEALAVHLADLSDAKLEQYIFAKANASTDDPWYYDRRLGHIYLR